MPRTVTSQVYQFDELSDEAKERARQWYRESGGPEDFEFVIDHAVRVGEALGIEFSCQTVKLYGGGTRADPRIYWSLGYSQGDYAAFEGRWRYEKGMLAKVKKDYPTETEIHRIAKELQSAAAQVFYKVYADCREERGNQRVNVEHSEDSWRELPRGVERDIEQALSDFASWIYDSIRQEDEYLSEDEQVDESIRINEYEFTEEGERA